jgi:glycosyl transferase family 25
MDYVELSNLGSIDNIKNVFYINLLNRTDRKEHVEKQLKSVGLNTFERFNAIRLANGALGCSMSHLKCLQLAKERKLDHILIVEDDITFTEPNVFNRQMNKCLENNKEWDVLLLAGNNIPPYKIVDESCIQVSHCQTTTGYLVRKHYYDILINNIREGINNLIREPNNGFEYAIDKHWLILQKEYIWILIIPLTVTQREDYSDIEKKDTNYSRLMLKEVRAH